MELSNKILIEMYWRMLLARRFDERAWALLRQGEIAYHMSGIGHEAIQVGAAFAIDQEIDWILPYYRDLALVLALGLTPREYMLGLMARRDDPASGGRGMPSLWSLKRARVVSHSGSVAAHTSHAAGIGLAIKLQGDRRVVLTTSGEGATSTGEWYEALNWAAIHKLPVVFLVENNRYALSTRQESQMAVEKVSEKARGLGLPGVTVDGLDLLASYQVVREAVDRARQGGGPSLVEAVTYRIPPHSSDDDDRRYRPLAEVKTFQERDPLPATRSFLETAGALMDGEADRLEAKAREIVEDAVRYARQAPGPAPQEGAHPVYAGEVLDG